MFIISFRCMPAFPVPTLGTGGACGQGRKARPSGTFSSRPALSRAGILHVMDSNGLALEHLSRDECMRLMAAVPVGRIVYTRQALPAVELVNFALADGDIVIGTDAGGTLAAAVSGAVVAFEADSVDFGRKSGWSVTAIGHCQAVTDEDELRLLRKLVLRPWTAGMGGHFIRIPPLIVTGRRVGTSYRLGSG
jgi:uncharacterized protein